MVSVVDCFSFSVTESVGEGIGASVHYARLGA